VAKRAVAYIASALKVSIEEETRFGPVSSHQTSQMKNAVHFGYGPINRGFILNVALDTFDPSAGEPWIRVARQNAYGLIVVRREQ
jgi:hypothetical protein